MKKVFMITSMVLLAIVTIIFAIPLLFFCFGIWVFTNSIHAFTISSSLVGKVSMALCAILGVVIIIATIEGLIAAATIIGIYFLYKLWRNEESVLSL